MCAEVYSCAHRDEVEMEMEEQPPLIGGSKPKEKKKKGKECWTIMDEDEVECAWSRTWKTK